MKFNRFTSRTTSRASRAKVLGLSGILAVGLLAVTTSTPALAVEAEPLSTTLDSPLVGQSIVVSSEVPMQTIQRDGFTAEAAPAPAPAPAPEPAPAPAPEPEPAPAAAPQGSGWVLPVSGTISDSFGPRPEQPVAGVNPFHGGTDIAAPSGTPVAAAAAGTVVEAGVYGTYGNWVLIDHGNGIQTGYAHNSAILVGVGQAVSAGETISLVGSTGASTGPHLHFEVRVNGTGIDSVPFMSERGVAIG